MMNKKPRHEVPELSDGRLRLRRHVAADVPNIVEQCRDPQSLRYTTVPENYTETDGQEFVENVSAWSGTNITWAVELGGEHVASLDLRGVVDDGGQASSPMLGFMTHPKYRGCGVMSDAVRLVLAYAFDVAGCPRVRWQAIIGNIASYKVVWRNGFGLPTLGDEPFVRRGEMMPTWYSELAADQPREPVMAWNEAVSAVNGLIQ